MPSTEPHVRLTAEGTLGAGSGNEIWSCSMKMILTDGVEGHGVLEPVQSDLDELALGGAVLWGAFIRDADSFSGTSLFESVVRLAAVKATGVRASDGKNDPATNPAIAAPLIESRGGATNPRVVYQNSIVITFRGDTYVRGSAALGRIYLPCPNLVATTSHNGAAMVDGLLDPGTVERFARSTSAFLTSLNSPNQVLSSGRSHLVANIGKSNDAAGTRHQAVTRVTVDNRPDSVRRRQNALSGRGVQSHAV